MGVVAPPCSKLCRVRALCLVDGVLKPRIVGGRGEEGLEESGVEARDMISVYCLKRCWRTVIRIGVE